MNLRLALVAAEAATSVRTASWQNQVLARTPETQEGQAGSPEAEPLLFWDFENSMTYINMSISAGIPSRPGLISGLVTQTGGGPAP